MAKRFSQLSRLWPRRPDPWALAALALAGLVLTPVFAIVWIAFNPAENIVPHLWATVLPRYLGTTLILMLGVAGLAAVMGIGTAWLVTLYRFPGRDGLALALMFPLAIPAYVGAYALVDVLDYAGPVQTGLRAAFGWTSARDYWFPESRSLGFAMLVLALALYPYVYILARSAFRAQAGNTHEVARALGTGPWALFWCLGLPLARPAIAAGLALVMMETIADYGAVYHFGVQTLTTGVFTTWLNDGNAAGAAQIAGIILMLILLLIGLERAGRGRSRFHGASPYSRPPARHRLQGAKAWLVSLACFLPFAGGFLLPVGVMLYQTASAPVGWLAPGLAEAFLDTMALSLGAAIATAILALVVVYALRQSRSPIPGRILSLTLIGYAAPGAVLALGLLFPLAAFDHWLADLVLNWTGTDPGLLITGTAFGLGIAYLVRFFGIAQGALDSAYGRITPTMAMAARSLGKSQGGTLAAVYVPLMRGSAVSAAVVVFVDCVKELPATLVLRPFNFNTLSTRVHELASLERLSEAAPAALMVMAVGLAAVLMMARGEAD